MSEIAPRSIRNTLVPVLAVVASLAPAAEMASAKAPGPKAQRVAYCMKQILKAPPRVAFDMNNTEGRGETFRTEFRTGIRANVVQDKKGKNCNDVAKREVRPLLTFNGEVPEELPTVKLVGNITTGRATVGMLATESQCVNGSMVAQGMAEVKANPVNPSMPAQMRTYKVPAFTVDC